MTIMILKNLLFPLSPAPNNKTLTRLGSFLEAFPALLLFGVFVLLLDVVDLLPESPKQPIVMMMSSFECF